MSIALKLSMLFYLKKKRKIKQFLNLFEILAYALLTTIEISTKAVYLKW